MEQMVARAKGKQNSTHDSHVVTAIPERRKKIGLYLLHFGRLPLPSFLLFSFGSVYRLGSIEIQGKNEYRAKKGPAERRREDRVQ